MAVNVTFLIGNGFDLKIGLKTRWSDFYEVYLNETENDTPAIKNFKATILKDKQNEWQNWSDFELGMGIESKNFNLLDFIDCSTDFVIKFNTYLKNECDKVDWNRTLGIHLNEFMDSIFDFHKKIEINLKTTDIQIKNFLQFNYTSAFDYFTNTFSISEKINNLHIHGRIDNHPIIGVDNLGQIANIEIRNYIKEIFIKQTMINELKKSNGRLKNSGNVASLLDTSDVICIFGSSIGATDMCWWKIIGDWLRQVDKTLIILDVFNREKDDGISPKHLISDDALSKIHSAEILNRFTQFAGLNEEEKNIYREKEKIIIKFNTTMFNFKLPMITEYNTAGKLLKTTPNRKKS
ncbi:MAG: bacteriophage abortive infection AbiH family protein [Ruminococcus sp.]|jgi:hypothetical protein|nr:bacteriophage abortive infection AbiH family protein [Ruminococcus sp.]